MLRLLTDSVVDILKILHRAKSIRSSQGVDDGQSSFHLDNQSATYELIPSYEVQLAQSSWISGRKRSRLVSYQLETLSCW